VKPAATIPAKKYAGANSTLSKTAQKPNEKAAAALGAVKNPESAAKKNSSFLHARRNTITSSPIKKSFENGDGS
jgi:hypothetical protein